MVDTTSQNKRQLISQESMFRQSRHKHVSDPIHGLIKLPRLTQSVIDTPHFQRLRDLAQLGCTSYVYPSANHTRFSHSLGVYHLANKMLNGIDERQPEVEINERDRRCVGLAALTHDLGHGPFSHLFDTFMHRQRPDLPWSHEAQSGVLLDDLLTEHQLWGKDGLVEEDVRLAKALIRGDFRQHTQEKRFIFDIVANQTNSLDVDKLDYLERDSYSLNIDAATSTERLLSQVRVFPTTPDNWSGLCYHCKTAFDVFEVYHTRFSLFKRVYTNTVVKAIDAMMLDAFQAADHTMRISQCVDDIPTYIQMTDTLLRDIERHPNPEGDKGMVRAQKIINDIRCRRLYSTTNEIVICKSHKTPGLNKLICMTEEEIVDGVQRTAIANGITIPADCVVVKKGKLDMSMKDVNPVDCILFWDNINPEPYKMVREQISATIPGQYVECVIQVMARTRRPDVKDRINRAFKLFVGSYDRRAIEDNQSTPKMKRTEPTSRWTGATHTTGARSTPVRLFQPNRIKPDTVMFNDKRARLEELEEAGSPAFEDPPMPGEDEPATPTMSPNPGEGRGFGQGSTHGSRVGCAVYLPSAFNTPRPTQERTD